MWLLMLSVGAVIGYGVAVCMVAAAREDESMFRCGDCPLREREEKERDRNDNRAGGVNDDNS